MTFGELSLWHDTLEFIDGELITTHASNAVASS
jgi:hypothetical protein